MRRIGKDYRGNLPVFAVMSDDEMHDITAAKKYIIIPSDNIYCKYKVYMSLPSLK